VAIEASLSHAQPVSGWSFGVCYPAAQLTAVGARLSTAIAGVQNGDGPDFHSIEFVPGGIAMNCVLDIFGAVTLPSGIQALLDIDFRIDAPVGTSSIITYCSGLGPPLYPATQIAIVVSGAGILPTLATGTVTSSLALPTFIFDAVDATVAFDPSTGAESFAVVATIAEHPGSPGAPNSTFGFSMAIAHDPDLLEVTGALPLGPIAALNGGSGPDFLGVQSLPDGLTAGVVYAFSGLASLAFPAATPALELRYATNSGTLLGQLSTVITELDWRHGLGEPPVSNVAVYDTAGSTSFVVGTNATITLVPLPEIFVRGDCTANGAYDLGDPIRLLGVLFSGAAPPDCDDACDGNDDGVLNIADVVAILSHQFAGGTPPPAPYPSCNTDVTNTDALDCDLFAPCP